MGYTTLQRKYYSKVGSGEHKHTARRAVHSAVEVVKVGVVLRCNVNRTYSSDFLPAVDMSNFYENILCEFMFFVL